jgi:simple sugar transport system substrate-binding protein
MKRTKDLMNRRDTLKVVGGTIVAGAATSSGFAFAEAQKKMVVIHKIAGIPWVNLMKDGVEKGGKDYGIDASLIGPTTADPALQAKLVEDVIAQKVAVLGVVPLDSNVLAPLLKRAHDAGITVLTLEGSNQPNRDWDVGMVDPIEYGETMMKRMAAGMGEDGEYVVIVGGLTTPVHKIWADAAVAYQEKNYPRMKQATDRFGMGESTDETQKTVLDVMKAHPKVKGFLIYGSPGPIGAGNALRQLKKHDVTVVGTCTPGQTQTLINEGWVKECFLWNPVDSGYAMVAIAKALLDGKQLSSGMEIPGVGGVVIAKNDTGGVVQLNKRLEVTKDNVDKLVSEGL